MKKKFPALEHLNYQRPPLLFMYEKDGSTLGVFTKKHEGYHCPIEYYSQQLSTALKYTIKYLSIALIQGYTLHFSHSCHCPFS